MQNPNREEETLLKTCSVQLVGLSVKMASRSVEKFFNRKLKKYGTTMAEIYAMYAISEYRGKSVAYMAEKLYMDRTTLTRQINKNKKYVLIYKNDMDKRFAYPALTPEGAEFLKKLMPKVMEIEKGLGILVSGKENFIKFIDTFSSDIVKNKVKVESLDYVANDIVFSPEIKEENHLNS